MEVVNPADDPKHTHKWLEWLGLEEPPPEPDSWVPVARACHVDGSAGKSSEAGRLVELLKRSGIEAKQRLYEFDTTRVMGLGGSGGLGGGLVTRVAVLVHDSDRARATGIASELKHEVDEAPQAPSDDELTRQALAAGPPPDGDI